MGMGGCLFGEGGFGEKSSTPYELSLQRVDVRPVLGPPPSTTTHNYNYSIFRDTDGVTYLQTTRNSKTLVCINDPANHARYVVDLTSPNSGTAVEFKLPQRNPGFGNGPRAPRGNAGNGPNPRWSAKTNPDFTRLAGATSQAQIQPYAGSTSSSTVQSWLNTCTGGLDVTEIKRGQFQSVRIFCSSLGVNLYTSTSGPYETSTVTATIVTPPAALQLPIQYMPGQNPPLPAGITIKQFNGRPRGGPAHGGAPPQP
jgi:hypothetical protein